MLAAESDTSRPHSRPQQPSMTPRSVQHPPVALGGGGGRRDAGGGAYGQQQQHRHQHQSSHHWQQVRSLFHTQGSRTASYHCCHRPRRKGCHASKARLREVVLEISGASSHVNESA